MLSCFQSMGTFFQFSQTSEISSLRERGAVRVNVLFGKNPSRAHLLLT